jgi:DNA-binding GntR family transcriptional regulator
MPAHHNIALDPWRGVHNAIRDAIIAGEFEPGARLVEQQLADRFGTSRGPVRTALQELERSGLVVSIDRRGTFVREINGADVEEIFSLWDLLFGFALRRAVERMTDEDAAWLAEIRDQPAPQDRDALMERLMGLSEGVFRMAQHGRALDIYRSLLVQAQARSLFDLSTSEEELAEHADVGRFCDALIARDFRAALQASNDWGRANRQYWADRLGDDVLPREPALAPDEPPAPARPRRGGRLRARDRA